MIELIVSLSLLTYTLIDTYVMQPDIRRGRSQTIFSFVDFPRPKDAHGRMPMSLFSKLTGVNNKGEVWWDKAAIYAGTPDEVLYGYFDKFDGFNADCLFDAYAFMCYWNGGAKANEIIFDRIINPMFNLGLKTVGGGYCANRFTNTDRRFFWLYDDFLRLQEIANAPAGKYMIKVYTSERKTAHTIDAKGAATALLAKMSNFPFICGYFIDGLSNTNDILSRELYILTDIKPANTTPSPSTSPTSFNIPKPVNTKTPPKNTKALKSVFSSSFAKSIGEKVLIGLIVTLILTFIIKYFKKK